MNTASAQKGAVLELRKKVKTAPKASILKQQTASLQDRGVKGDVWVSKVAIPKPLETRDSSLATILWDVLKLESEGFEILEQPKYSPVLDGEWTGHRAGVKDPKEPQPPGSERERFDAIRQGQRSDYTIFYLHGGAWFRGSPATSGRPAVRQFCRMTGARTFSVKYRLAPQHTLSDIILDALVAYFYLLSPPQDAFHEPIPASSIVLAGESSGAALHLAVIQVLKHLIDDATAKGISSPTLHVNGRDVPIKMPAGCAIICPPADFSFVLPSNAKYAWSDWLSEGPPWLKEDFPADSIWPTDPPRGHLHSDVSAVLHPLFCATTRRDWTGAPPLYLACGDESGYDGIALLAQRFAASGVPVRFRHYEFMPHIFPLMLPQLPQAQHCMADWARACSDMAAGKGLGESTASFFSLGKLERRALNLDELTDLTFDSAMAMMKAERTRLEGFAWTGLRKRDSVL